uniref:Uncharacterized protein n=1 Tax=Amphimedon queenslandica TaxID=400682 RepID=A0A1X7U0E2_AMPQE
MVTQSRATQIHIIFDIILMQRIQQWHQHQLRLLHQPQTQLDQQMILQQLQFVSQQQHLLLQLLLQPQRLWLCLFLHLMCFHF